MSKLRSSVCVLGLLPMGAALAIGGCKSQGDPGVGGGDLIHVDDRSVVQSKVPPPPISGGTLTITADGTTAVVADPDRDRVLVVDLDAAIVRGEIPTGEGSEPGRSVEGDGGVAFVALRRGGKVVSVDLATGAALGETAVCGAPRGLAFDAHLGELHVACAGGDLVTLSTRGARLSRGSLRVRRTLRVGDDLRDVVDTGQALLVSHFRSAAIDAVDASGKVERATGPEATAIDGFSFQPGVAWRMVGVPGGLALLLHQQARVDPLQIEDRIFVAPVPGASTAVSTGASGFGDGGGAYGGSSCAEVPVHSQLTLLGGRGVLLGDGNTGALASMPLAVDVAVSRAPSNVAILSASSGAVYERSIYAIEREPGCTAAPVPVGRGGQVQADGLSGRSLPSSDEPIALAYRPDASLVVQIRQPSELEIHDHATGDISRVIALGGPSRADTGHAMFHGAPPGDPKLSMACASCHPEGRDDGHVWQFIDGPKRTSSLAAFSVDTAPFHWAGDVPDVSTLVDQIYSGRMGAPPQSLGRKAALARWLGTIPSAPATSAVDPASAARGKILFDDPAVGCASCHGGPRFTNDETMDVGTGGPFQVPSLVGVGARAPYMHDGCAKTLRDRFEPVCGGGDVHGVTSPLAEGDLDDLVSYLETL